jgi:mono/diheme cytochrome c family protein/uncharacterized membrane protein
MQRAILIIGCVLSVGLGWSGTLSAADAPRDLASETRAIFSAKCTNCHGPNLAKPKGRFGYVLDLARVAANREMIVPSAPEESELWDLVSHNEMPPPDSPTGPLSAAQKEVIRSWIAAGAPSSSPSTPPPTDQQTDEAASPPPTLWMLVSAKLGPLHVAVVHFPIALLIAAAVAEFWSALRGQRLPTPTVRFCILLGSVSALAAAGLGWLLAGNGYGAAMPQVLNLHRWIGTTTALWALGTMLLSEWEERRGVRTPWFRAWLFFGALLVAAAGHLGGVLVHGDQFFTGA